VPSALYIRHYSVIVVVVYTKRDSRVSGGLSEAKRRGTRNVAEWASRRSAAEGLGVIWYARDRETTAGSGLESCRVWLFVSARSAYHITE
jgi:hypothetical protein